MGARRTILWALRLSTLATLCIALWMLAVTPLGRMYVQNTSDELSAALAKTLAQEFDQAWLDETVGAALAEEPANWILVESALEIGQENGLTPGPEAAVALEQATARDKSTLGQAGNCYACAAGDPKCRLDDGGVVCAIGVELTPIGDARVLWAEGQAYAKGEEVDQLGVTLAGVGLAATVAVVASAGSSAPVKGGVAVVRVARKAGKLSPGLQTRLVRIGGELIHWDKLPTRPRALLDPAAYRAAVNQRALAEGTELVGSLDRLRRAVPGATALALLPLIDNGRDAQRVARIAEASGAKSVGIFHRLGKTRAMRITAKLSRTGRTLFGLAAALAAQMAALLAVVAQAGLSRVVRGVVKRG